MSFIADISVILKIALISNEIAIILTQVAYICVCVDVMMLVLDTRERVKNKGLYLGGFIGRSICLMN